MTTSQLPYANQYTRRHPARYNAIKKLALRLINALPEHKRANALYAYNGVILVSHVTRKSMLEMLGAYRLAATE